MRSFGWARIQFDWCPYEKGKFGHTERYQGCVHTEDRSCEDTARRWPSTRQGERPQDLSALPTHWSRTSGIQNGEKINCCCLSHAVCGILLWQNNILWNRIMVWTYPSNNTSEHFKTPSENITTSCLIHLNLQLEHIFKNTSTSGKVWSSATFFKCIRNRDLFLTANFQFHTLIFT